MTEKSENKSRSIRGVCLLGSAATAAVGLASGIGFVIAEDVVGSRVESRVAKEHPPIVSADELTSAGNTILLFDREQHESLVKEGRLSISSTEEKGRVIEALSIIDQEDQRQRDIVDKRRNLSAHSRRDLFNNLGMAGVLMWGLGLTGGVLSTVWSVWSLYLLKNSSRKNNHPKIAQIVR